MPDEKVVRPGYVPKAPAPRIDLTRSPKPEAVKPAVTETASKGGDEDMADVAMPSVEDKNA